MLLTRVTIVFFTVLVTLPIMSLAANKSESLVKPRVLLIAIDAIPYSVIKELHDPQQAKQQLFANLKGPTAVITTFPSNSYVAWSGLLQPFGIEKSLGYEARYFNNTTHEVSGGLSLKKVPAPWKDFFNWKLDGVIKKAIAYGWPQKYSLEEMEDGLQAFLESEKQNFSMYIVSTDGVGHIQGPTAFAEFLVKLDKRLIEFKAAHPEMPFYTIMISDHGMEGGEPLVNVWPDVESRLTEAGFNVTEELDDKQDAALIAFGLLNSFVAYTWPGDEQKIASLATSVTGVDICVTRDTKGWRVHSSRGDALISKRQKAGEDYWSYSKINGDPLNYQDAIAAMRKRIGKSEEIWFSDKMWFEFTKNHFYPDAVYRLANSLDLPSNPTSVSCSISQGYMFGALKTEYIAIPTIGRLRWTHGALHKGASLGFMMSDLPDWSAPDYVRYNQALLLFEKLQHQQLAVETRTIKKTTK